MANTTAFKKGEKRPNQGRPKGLLNKTTQSAKDAIAQAAEELGGTARLVDWVKEDTGNEKVFWGTIYPKLLPLQVNASVTINPIADLLAQVNGSQLTPNDDTDWSR